MSLLLFVTIGYFAVNIGEVYLRYYAFDDAIQQEVRFASTRTDDAIRHRLVAIADSLGLPEEAGHVQVYRTTSRITISADYSEHVELPLFVRAFRFQPRADGGL
ncbi:MAG: hypothetical protein ABI910_19670 [Gemmatimonadota bacterium]